MIFSHPEEVDLAMQIWLIIFGLTLGALIIIDGLRRARLVRRTPHLGESHALEPAPTYHLRADDTQAGLRGSATELLSNALDLVSASARRGYVPNVRQALTQAAHAPSSHPQASPLAGEAISNHEAKLLPLHQARCEAATEALQRSCLMVRLVDAHLAWGTLQQALRAEHMVYDTQHGVYHAADAEGAPAFSVTSPFAPGALPAPRDALDDESVNGLLLLLPAAEAERRVLNFERMVAFVYACLAEGGGRLLDGTGSAATRQTLEFSHAELMEQARQAALAAAIAARSV